MRGSHLSCTRAHTSTCAFAGTYRTTWSSHSWQISPGLCIARIPLRWKNSLKSTGRYHLTWTGGCFLWSMDQRLHHIFVRSFVAREFCKQILDAGMDSPTGSFDLGILSKAVASLSYHLGTNSGRVCVYFKSTRACDSQFSMVLCTHKDVSCLRRFWRFCPLLALLFFSEL